MPAAGCARGWALDALTLPLYQESQATPHVGVSSLRRDPGGVDWEATMGIQVQDPLGRDGRNVFCGFRAGHCGLFPDSRCLSVGVWRFSLPVSYLREGLRELALSPSPC